MSMTDDVSRTHADPLLRRVMLFLTLMIVLGVIGTAATIINAQTTRTASKADVREARRVVERLAALERASALNVNEHRVRNQQDHDDICRLIYEIVQASPTLRNRGIMPCAARDPKQAVQGGLPAPIASPPSD